MCICIVLFLDGTFVEGTASRWLEVSNAGLKVADVNSI